MTSAASTNTHHTQIATHTVSLAPNSYHRQIGDVEWLILDLLLEHRHRTWGIGELVDAIGSPIAVADALEALQVAGLIERKDAFVRVVPT